MKINWNEPKFGKFELDLVKDVLESGYVSEGPITKELEERLAKIIGCKYVIMTTSCTAALYLAVKTIHNLNGQRTTTVLLPNLTFVGTKNAVNIVKYLDTFLSDVDDKRFILDLKKEKIVLKGPAVIPIFVNILGRGIDKKIIEELKIAEVSIICDNAGCLGSDVPIGDIGCYSLQGNKIISCGQGGFCATNDEKMANEIRRIKDFGRKNKDENNSYGFNFKFNDILAAVALGQLKYLEERKELLKGQYNYYKDKIGKYGRFIEYYEGEIPLWIEFITDRRDELVEFLKKENITCRIPWKPFELKGNAKFYYENCVWLPNGPSLLTEDLEFTANKIIEFFKTVPKIEKPKIELISTPLGRGDTIHDRVYPLEELYPETPLTSLVPRHYSTSWNDIISSTDI